MTSWLKKIGAILVKAEDVILGLQQFIPQPIAGAVATVQDVISQALGVVIQVEAMGQALSMPGAQKLQAAVAQGTQIFLDWTSKLGHKVNDQSKFIGGVTKVYDGLADIANSWKDSTIETKSVS